MGRLDGKVAVVTGASSGLGRTIALTYAKEGAKVVCCDKISKPRPEGYDDDKDFGTDELIIIKGGDAIYVACDITNENDVERAIRTAAEEYGRIDIMVCNAGVYKGGAFIHRTDLNNLDLCLDVNLRANFLISKHALDYMIHRNIKGTFVFTLSSSALNPYATQSVYNISKAACAMLVKTIAVEYGRLGIRANGMCPTTFKSAIAAFMYDTYVDKVVAGRNPLGVLGVPQDVANLALFLGSDESGWMNGNLVALDGGETMSNQQISDIGYGVERIRAM